MDQAQPGQPLSLPICLALLCYLLPRPGTAAAAVTVCENTENCDSFDTQPHELKNTDVKLN